MDLYGVQQLGDHQTLKIQSKKFVRVILLRKESLNSDGHKFHQYQQN